jgi:hypothetical protein
MRQGVEGILDREGGGRAATRGGVGHHAIIGLLAREDRRILAQGGVHLRGQGGAVAVFLTLCGEEPDQIVALQADRRAGGEETPLELRQREDLADKLLLLVRADECWCRLCELHELRRPSVRCCGSKLRS